MARTKLFIDKVLENPELASQAGRRRFESGRPLSEPQTVKYIWGLDVSDWFPLGKAEKSHFTMFIYLKVIGLQLEFVHSKNILKDG